MKKHLALYLILIASVGIFAQRESIELLGADELEGVFYKGEKANMLNGNVRIKHSGSLMSCNRAYLFVGQNNFDAFGNINIRQNDGLTIYGDSLFYNGDTKIAKLRGNVRVIDKQMTLTTRILDYNMGNKTAIYYGGGTIIDNGISLKSEKGYLDSKSDLYTFRGNVKVIKDKYTIICDTLKYASIPQKAFFYGPTNIYSNDQNLYAESGMFNTKENKAWFNKNAWVETPTYKLFGDSLYFDNNKNYGYAVNHVKIESYKEKATIYGDVAISDGAKFQKKVYGNALMIDYSEKDTTYIQADTLISIDDTIKNNRNIKAINNVQVVKGSLSAISDFMVYNDTDSNIIFKKDPMLWSGQNQIKGDSIKILLNKGAVDKMYVYENAFIISQNETDTSKYTQVKGREMLAYFTKGELNRLDVNGNGESIYYAFDEEKTLIGLNNVVCSNMKMYIVDGDMSMVKFYDRPIASFSPPQLIDNTKTRLQGFKWEMYKKPISENIIAKSSLRTTKKEVVVQETQETSNSKESKKDKKTKKDKKKKIDSKQ